MLNTYVILVKNNIFEMVFKNKNLSNDTITPIMDFFCQT